MQLTVSTVNGSAYQNGTELVAFYRNRCLQGGSSIRDCVKSLRIACLLVVAVAAVAQSAPTGDQAAEQEMLRLVNLARAREGLTSLRLDPKLQDAARQHSQRMAKVRQLSHQLSGEPVFSKRLQEAGAQFSSSGENVAFNQTAQAAHEDLMQSPPHRANILSPKFNAIGIGVAREGENLWVTEDFASEFEKVSGLQARDEVFAAFAKARHEASSGRVKLINLPKVQTEACRMSQTGKLDTSSVLAINGVRTAAAYTTSDLSQLPSTARKLAGDASLRQIALGACFGTSSRYPAGMYWVVIAGY